MKKDWDRGVLFFIKALVAMVFLSKISFGTIFPIPDQLGPFLFQKGMHPYVNIFLCAVFGIPLVILGKQVRSKNNLGVFYKIFVWCLAGVLTFQTLMQTQFVNEEESQILQLGALGSTLFMIYVYGVLIPQLWSLESFLNYVKAWSGWLVLLSLMFLLIPGVTLFKGGRFIGVFKHIPYMVTCATVAFIFSLNDLFGERVQRQKIFAFVVVVASFAAIILTGTRSSAAAAVIAFLLMSLLQSSSSNQGRILKLGFILGLISFTLFFGSDVFNFIQGLATGQSALGSRGMQDGVASRWEEVVRGGEIFLQQPWLGHGLVSKFSASSEIDISNYNSFKDPHNIFLSAGVVGGWPLITLSAVALVLAFIGSIKTLKYGSQTKRDLGVYLLSHLPILVIYHLHLSLGGMADRIYWLVFGFVALRGAYIQLEVNGVSKS